MKTTYVDPATGERHILVRLASDATAAMMRGTEDNQELLLLMLRNQATIMQALEDVAKPAHRDALQAQRKQTETRLAQPPAKKLKVAA